MLLKCIPIDIKGSVTFSILCCTMGCCNGNGDFIYSTYVNMARFYPVFVFNMLSVDSAS